MKTILLIEDNNDIRENMAEIIEMANYKVLTAADGKQGVELAMKQKPDLVVCDIMMPVLDGYGVLHMLHKNPDLKSVPFIFLSAMAERAEVRKGMELGADDYITKPCSGTELLNAIESRLKRADLARQQFSPDLEGVNNLIQSVSGAKALQDLVKDRDMNDYAGVGLTDINIFFVGYLPARFDDLLVQLIVCRISDVFFLHSGIKA